MSGHRYPDADIAGRGARLPLADVLFEERWKVGAGGTATSY